MTHKPYSIRVLIVTFSSFTINTSLIKSFFNEYTALDNYGYIAVSLQNMKIYGCKKMFNTIYFHNTMFSPTIWTVPLFFIAYSYYLTVRDFFIKI